MHSEWLEVVVRSIDARLTRREQFLPTVAAREELRAAIAPLVTHDELQAAMAHLATHDELQAAMAPLTTRAEMHAAIQAAVALLATRDEMHAAIEAATAPLATLEQLRVEGERSRRHATLLFDVRDDIRIVLEHVGALSARVDALAQR
jgi:hypothetical protein